MPEDVLQADQAADTDPARPEPLWTPKEKAPEEETDVESAPATVAPPANSKPNTREDAEEPVETSRLAEEKALYLRKQRAVEGLNNGWTDHPET